MELTELAKEWVEIEQLKYPDFIFWVGSPLLEEGSLPVMVSITGVVQSLAYLEVYPGGWPNYCSVTARLPDFPLRAVGVAWLEALVRYRGQILEAADSLEEYLFENNYQWVE